MASALVEAIKVAGLVLVADTTTSPLGTLDKTLSIVGTVPHNAAEGVNGVLNDNGVLRFYDTIDV